MIIEFGCIFYLKWFISFTKIMLVSQPALAMGLGGTCMMYHEEILRKGRTIVSLNVDYNLT